MPEKHPKDRTPLINSDDAYRRFTHSAAQAFGVFYARRAPEGDEMARLLNVMYSDYGRD